MSLLKEFSRIDYSRREPHLNWYGTAKADATDLDALLKVKDVDDALDFIVAYSPLFSYGFSQQVTLPSKARIDTQRSMVFDVLNTVQLMRFAIETHHLSEKLATKETLERRGYNPHMFSHDELEDDQSLAQSIVMMKDYVGYDFGVGKCICSYPLSLSSYGEKVLATDMDDPYLGMVQFESNDDDFDFVILRGVADDDGESIEAYAQALDSIVCNLFTYALSGVSLAPHNMQMMYSAKDYASYLWCTLFDRLSTGEIRRCNVCGKYFVANLGDANERGGSKKTNCGPNCRQMGYKARKAKELIEEGVDIEAAAKAQHISVEKLKTFLELNPIDSEGR